jgi:phosphatidylserine/phosphatidylglycerophosphate/cardiolipin synthase-like enzyme
MRDASPKYRYAWRDGNRFELLIDGPAYFPRMLEAIELARTRVWLEIYLLESGAVADRFVGALVHAAARGVEVRVLADAYGAARFEDADRRRLLDAGVRLVFYNPIRWRQWFGNLFRDHRKLLIVDGAVAFVSGTGVTDDFDNPRHPERSWRDTALRISGPVLADWQALFIDVWRRYSNIEMPAAPAVPAAFADGRPGRVACSASLKVQDIRRSLYKRVRAAERCVWMATAYFVPSRKLLNGLKRAARRGVDVRLLLPGPHSDHPAVRHAGRRFYTGLLRAGVRVFEYQPRFLHAKTMVCDDWVSVGSSNFDRWNLRWNLEANQEVDDSRFAAAARAMFERDFLVSDEIDIERWRRRGLRQRLREQLWGRVDRMLENIGRRRGIRMRS